ncbi:endolytic transglycosylase MltG [Propionibacterium sp.]|uniref:endolytic transglycosylase MltG n=1 Tax=Propionibacterium sp. TaxID=1977903 RepID=UPI0039EA01AC
MAAKRRADDDGLDGLLGTPGRQAAPSRARRDTQHTHAEKRGARKTRRQSSGGRTRRTWPRTLLVVMVSLAVLVGGGMFAYHKIGEAWRAYQGADYGGEGTGQVLVDIDAGQSVGQMGDLLVSQDVVASSRAFMRAARSDPRTNSIHSGTYRLKKQMSAKAAVTALVDPANIITQQVTLPEGLRNTEVFAKVHDSTGIPVAQFDAIAANPTGLGLPGYAKGNTEGFLFPNTYTFNSQSTARTLMGDMVKQFNTVAAQDGLESRAEAIHRSPLDVVIVASIIERETVKPQYGPQMAEVFYNRLDKGMKLQSDATVHYATNTSGTVTTTDAERAVNSPYNTYLVDGLPPGPISNPGRQALDAAMHPASGDLLYFVTVNPDTGETNFAANGEDHEKNVQQFQAWCQDHAGRCG